MNIKNSQLPNLPVNSDRVTLMRDMFERFKNNYEGMLYFCSRILQKPQDQISMLDLKQFEEVRFARQQQMIKNFEWPVSYYLETIKSLEAEINMLRAKL